MDKKKAIGIVLLTLTLVIVLLYMKCGQGAKEPTQATAETSAAQVSNPDTNSVSKNESDTSAKTLKSQVSAVSPKMLEDQKQEASDKASLIKKTESIDPLSSKNGSKSDKRTALHTEESPPPPTVVELDQYHRDTEGDYDTAPPPVEVVGDDEVYTFVQEMPLFPGGEVAMYKFLNSNIKYPEMEEEAEIEGTVYVQFIVEKDGSVSNVKALKAVAGGPGLTKEALRVVKLFPKFNPGKMYGRAVRTQMNLPVKFKLN